MTDIIVIGAGPAGVLAALRTAELGAHTTLVASGGFGGMAANDGPVPVRVLAHTARLLRDARQVFIFVRLQELARVVVGGAVQHAVAVPRPDRHIGDRIRRR